MEKREVYFEPYLKAVSIFKERGFAASNLEDIDGKKPEQDW